jgi:hypothetical protein
MFVALGRRKTRDLGTPPYYSAFFKCRSSAASALLSIMSATSVSSMIEKSTGAASMEFDDVTVVAMGLCIPCGEW